MECDESETSHIELIQMKWIRETNAKQHLICYKSILLT